jgi:hypothetical protein
MARTETKDLVGRKVVDPHGDKIGTIDALLIHGEEDRANWARIKTGPLGMKTTFVPLHDAQDEDGDVRLVYEREHVQAAPKIEPEGDHLTDEEADALHTHYGLERVIGLTSDDEEDDIELSRETRDATPPAFNEGPFPKPPIPGIPEDEQPSPIKKEDKEESEDEGD